VNRASRAIAGWIIAPALLALGALLALDRLYHSEYLRIREVEVHGRFTRVDGGQVKAVVESALPGHYFSVELADIEARIGRLPWVFSASVRRRWPDTLVVEVAEVQPVAQWGERQWLNLTGDLVERPAAAEGRDLPMLSGPQEHKEAVWRAFLDWSKAFAARGLILDALRFDARGLWHLTLSVSALAPQRRAAAADGPSAPVFKATPVALIVQQHNAGARIRRFVRALRHSLIGDFSAIRSIDLRYPNGFAVNWKAGAQSLVEAD